MNYVIRGACEVCMVICDETYRTEVWKVEVRKYFKDVTFCCSQDRKRLFFGVLANFSLHFANLWYAFLKGISRNHRLGESFEIYVIFISHIKFECNNWQGSIGEIVKFAFCKFAFSWSIRARNLRAIPICGR